MGVSTQCLLAALLLPFLKLIQGMLPGHAISVMSQTQVTILITAQIPKLLEKLHNVNLFASIFNEVTTFA